MAFSSSPGQVLGGVPADLRQPIISGLRWTLWLAALSMPLGYATRLLLARTGPQVIGSFGLLLVYVNLVSTFFFLGGNAVAIRFLPHLQPEQRRSFLGTYSVVVLLALAPWLLLAGLWPQSLHYLFGDVGGRSFQQIMLWLSPAYIALSLSTAALKGLLRIKWAQILSRTVTIGSFLAYALLFFLARPLLATHYAALLWGIYLGLGTIVALVALALFFRLTPRRPANLARWFLPAGFWGYTLGLQSTSAVNFLATQLDSLFVLNWGSLRLLGFYVALMTLVLITPTILNLFLDTLLPSLTNALARQEQQAAEDLAETCGRILFPSSLAMSALLALFAMPLVRMFGAQYASLANLVRLAAPLAAIATASHLFGTLFSATGHPQRATMAQLLRLGVFIALFPPLWSRYHLGGAVMTWMASELVHHFANLFLLRWRPPLHFRLSRGYVAFWAVLIAVSALADAAPHLSFGLAGTAWLAAMLLFLLLAGYRPDELRSMATLLW